jgi:vancomycin permeability regulator SanA
MVGKGENKEKKSDKKSNRYILRRALLLVLILCFAGGASLLGINVFMKSSVDEKIITAEQAKKLDADCILVLGAGVYGDDKPSLMLRDRLDKGIELYDLAASDRLLMTGDHGRVNYDEVNVMKQYAINEGIPSQNIFMDHAGFSTYESMYRARDIFQAKKVVIVTQEYHLYRALYIAEKLGLEAWGVATDSREYGGQDYRDAREVLARVKDFFYTIIQPEPTFLGSAIPVNGNGDMTNDKELSTNPSK